MQKEIYLHNRMIRWKKSAKKHKDRKKEKIDKANNQQEKCITCSGLIPQASWVAFSK